jgi:hypothetical protein
MHVCPIVLEVDLGGLDRMFVNVGRLPEGRVGEGKEADDTKRSERESCVRSFILLSLFGETSRMGKGIRTG